MAGATDGSSGSEAAFWSGLVFPSCGLGLNPPINFFVQTIVLPSGGDKREEGEDGAGFSINLLRGIWRGRSLELRRSSRSRGKSWQTKCLLH